MLGKKSTCGVCGAKLHGNLCTQLPDGKVCFLCARICKSSSFAPVETVKQAWEENQRRYQQFHTFRIVTSLMCGFIYVDFDHKLAYVSSTKKPKVTPIVFQFSEIEQYSIEQVGSKTVTKTKTKGGIGRAIVGGAVAGPIGAIVGSATAKTQSETKTVNGTRTLVLKLNINGLKTAVSLSNPPSETETIINSMMKME